jgi:putative zinc finger/helix-turn-helix YgiT family protein
MKNSVLSFPAAKARCPLCGELSTRVSYERETFPYGVGENQVSLTVHVPVIQCDACGGEVTAAAAEEIRHAAVCHHLGRLSPNEVRAIREQYGLTQQEWANKTKLGVASIKRWESGNLIQNEAMDCYMRLLAIPSNLTKISSVDATLHLQKGYRFRTNLSPTVLEAALAFELRKAS